jgi:hypothetical protein
MRPFVLSNLRIFVLHKKLGASCFVSEAPDADLIGAIQVEQVLQLP